jgi:hypothetical protein
MSVSLFTGAATLGGDDDEKAMEEKGRNLLSSDPWLTSPPLSHSQPLRISVFILVECHRDLAHQLVVKVGNMFFDETVPNDGSYTAYPVSWHSRWIDNQTYLTSRVK